MAYSNAKAREKSKLEARASASKALLAATNPVSAPAAAVAAGGLGYVVEAFRDTDLRPALNEVLAGRVFVSRLSPQRGIS
jgi:hypothetical protein